MKILIGKKAEINVIPVVIGAIFLAILIPVIYVGVAPVSTIETVTNVSTALTSGTAYTLPYKDIVPSSETLYNATNTSITVGEGITGAVECGNEGNACYYNFTDGDKITFGTVTVNSSGTYYVSYRYYPSAYSHNVSDRNLVILISTFLILGVLVIIAKLGGLM